MADHSGEARSAPPADGRPRSVGVPPAGPRVGRVLFALATACGVWFGVTAPDVSPVAPPPGAEGAPAAGEGR